MAASVFAGYISVNEGKATAATFVTRTSIEQCLETGASMLESLNCRAGETFSEDDFATEHDELNYNKVETDVEPISDPATREWHRPRAKHISSKFCRNLEYVQHFLETGMEDQLSLLFLKSINVNDLYQRAKYKPTNYHFKHKTLQDVDCQTDAASYSIGTSQTQTCTNETACQTELCLEETGSQTEVCTSEVGNQTTISTGDFAMQTEIHIKEFASQTEISAKDIGSQTAISTAEFSTQTVIDAAETACQTENFNSEAASQTEKEIRSTTQTNTRASHDDQQPECLDCDKGDQLTADERTKDRKVYTRASNDDQQPECLDCDKGDQITADERTKDRKVYIRASNDDQQPECLDCDKGDQLTADERTKDRKVYTRASNDDQQPECLDCDKGDQLTADERTKDRKVYNRDDYRDNECESNIPERLLFNRECDFGGGGDKNSEKEVSDAPDSSGRCIEKTSINPTATCRKQEDELSGCSGAISVPTSESIRSVTTEVLSLGDCSRRSLSAIVAPIPSAESCASHMSCRSYSKSPQVAAPEVAAPVSVLPAVPEIPAEQLAIKYTLGKSKIVLGAGTYGTVYLVTHVPTNTTIVCKEQYLATSSYESILREASIQLYLHATNRVPFMYGISTTFGEAGTVCIFQQYHNNCPTVEDLFKLPAGHISKKEWVQLAFDICAGLADIHQMGVLHNDIKANNLIVVTETPPYRVKLIDFGLASDKNGMRYNSSPVDAEKYPHLAPETFYNLPTTVKSDIFSAGYVLKLVNEIVQSPLIDSITDRCFKENPDDRPSLTSIMATLNYIITSIFFS